MWHLVETERVNMVMITGDAMGKPLVEVLDEPGANYDLSSFFGLTSTAALFSPVGEGRILPPFPPDGHDRRSRLFGVGQQRPQHGPTRRDRDEERTDRHLPR